ncbi:3-ketoacyl-CoA thiolase [Rhodococcus wratislaviensis]|uniref:3-ketoacyl-CoA thiolase n=1 Tax=Rhodococcus wratislaviensis TaxID=44752 RepID=A0A402CF32_RHOWR|nr:acetyl-CoA acetyltransferase [Rhodococcus wratislaviensis]GCE42149.1 3-ketoacyl-CoA thiolase [Rhodococcus wratislaviensis]
MTATNAYAGAAIVGVAESELGVTDQSALGLQAQAVVRALDDAGLTLSDVDGIATTGIPRFPAIQTAEYLGIHPTWSDSTFSGGSSFEVLTARAAEAITSGNAEVVVVVYGSNQRSARSRKLGGVLDPMQPESQFDAPFGPLSPVSFYALAAQRHMHQFGTTSEQLAEVAVAAREWALLNPRAYRYGGKPLSVDDVLSSPVISAPLHALDCCLVTDGGGAVVLTSAARAADLRRRPVYVLGHGECSTHHGFTQMPDLTRTGAITSASAAFRQAGLGPEDIDVVQVYDSFTITALLSLEALGFCGHGEGGDFISDGKLRPGGSLPFNTTGGGLSYTHPGMFGIFLIIEAVRQLRCESEERQIPGAQTAVCHGTGGILSHNATLILGADR